MLNILFIDYIGTPVSLTLITKYDEHGTERNGLTCETK